MKNNVFENIKHLDINGIEFWYAREYQKALTYTEWRKFEKVIYKSKEACINSNIDVKDHFVEAAKMI